MRRWVLACVRVSKRNRHSRFTVETRLAVEPAATRSVGVTLMVLMIVRPQDLLGKAEVKIL